MTEDADTVVDQKTVDFYRRARAMKKMADAIWNQQEGVSREGFQDRILAAEALFAVLKAMPDGTLNKINAKALATSVPEMAQVSEGFQ